MLEEGQKIERIRAVVRLSDPKVPGVRGSYFEGIKWLD